MTNVLPAGIPRRRRLVVAVVTAGVLAAYVQRIGGKRRLVAHGEYPRWAPDGRHLALTIPGATGFRRLASST